ncbi:MAG: DUF1559 domain-containing protein [Gemmataceae bacterium]|nr:DUF1559 domain-containing protein [Gemmataceae bacterium]
MVRRILPRLLGAACLLALGWMALPALSRPAADDEKPLGRVPADLALVPRDAVMFWSFRLADVTEAAAFKSLAGTPALREFDRFWRSLGLKPSEVERVTLAFRRTDQQSFAVIRTLKAYDADGLRKRMGLDQEHKAHGKTFHSGSSYSGPAAAWFADDRTLVVGDPRSLVPYLAVMEKPGKTHAFADELAEAAGTHSMTMAILPERMTRMQPALDKAREERWRRERMKDRKDFPKEDKRKDGFEPKDKFGARRRDRFMVAAYQPKEAYYKDMPYPREKEGRYVPRRPPVRPDELKEDAIEPGTLEEAFDSLDHWGFPFSAPFRPAMRCKRLLVTATAGDEISAKAVASFGSEAEAKDGLATARMALVLARDGFPLLFREGTADAKTKELADFVATVQDILRAAETKQYGKTVTASAKGRIDTKALAKYAAEQVPVVTDANNLRQIGLAFHNVHDAGDGMPRAICDRAGKPLLSWRVAILPYIEQEALYKRFKLDEPWDSPHNKKLLGKMPEIYAPVKGATAEPDATHYQVFGGPGTLFPKPDAKAQLFRIRDGSSNTFLVAESSKAVPWTKPQDMEVTERALPALGGQFAKFFHAVMCDGSVRKIKRGADEKLLRWLIDPSDGNPVDIDALKP